MTTPDPDLAAHLSPCPLCGGEAEIWRAHMERTAWIGCMGKCSVLVSREYKTDADAIAAWNTRVPADHTAAVQAAVANAVEAERVRADSMARSARETEREACAVIASKGSYSSADPYSIGCGQRIAAAIRARKGDAL